ncbi:hypothetical protein [Halobellus sp. GM3]|uniref:hypothetical protein n=1 Tax=Halobellus sp. GM3 TaxID=3458410 RepID=UPI00403DEC35
MRSRPPPDSQTGCRFHDQCPHAVDGCAVGGQPPLYDVPAATVSGPDRAEGEGCPDRSAADRERASKGNDEHVAACVHFAPEGDPSAVYGSGNDSVRGDDADGGRPVGREGER